MRALTSGLVPPAPALHLLPASTGTSHLEARILPLALIRDTQRAHTRGCLLHDRKRRLEDQTLITRAKRATLRVTATVAMAVRRSSSVVVCVRCRM